MAPIWGPALVRGNMVYVTNFIHSEISLNSKIANAKSKKTISKNSKS